MIVHCVEDDLQWMMMVMKYLIWAVTILLLGAKAVVAAPSTSSPAGADPAARSTVDRITSQAIAALGDSRLTPAQKNQKIRQIAEQSLDFETLARLSMGRYWSGLSQLQRAELVEAFRQHMLVVCGQMTDAYGGQELASTGDQLESDGDCTVFTGVFSKDAGAHDEIAKVAFRVRKRDQSWKVIDVRIAGISLLAGFREQFQAIMSNGGFDKLLQILRQNSAAPATQP